MIKIYEYHSISHKNCSLGRLIKILITGIMLRDPDRAAISSTEDERMKFLLKLADQILEICSKEKVRVKQISQDTASRFYHVS